MNAAIAGKPFPAIGPMRHLTKKIQSFTLTTMLLIFASSAFAWNESGHRQTALIAYELVEQDKRQKILSLIKRHPRYKQDFINKQPKNFTDWNLADQERWIFSQIAVWPDAIKRVKSESVKKQFNHGKWHYINLPVFPTDEMARKYKQTGKNNLSRSTDKLSKNLNIMQVLNYLDERFKAGNSSVPKSVLLCWLFHLVGDIHQPVHSSALFTPKKFKRGDLGGNAIAVGNQNLHRIWDGAGGGSTQISKLKALAKEVTGENKNYSNTRLKQLQNESLNNLDFEAWLEESHELAKSEVYAKTIHNNKSLGEITIDLEAAYNRKIKISMNPEYRQNMKQIAERRIVEAGYRLAGLLNSGDYL